jgi:serine/threonine protein kinase
MADSLLGRQLDEYRLEKLLGQGGMARVYRGVDTLLKRYVAIKVIDVQFRHDTEYARRFEIEAQSLAQLNHPNVVQLYRYGNVDNILYMAMAYIEGSDVKAALDDYHAAGEYMAIDEALRILRETAAALDYVHSKGIIHRDIKPSNIMLTQDGTSILTDFGLALMTQVGTMGEIFGTPQYLSPEQAISSAAVVPQSDLYSLGIIAYEMFTGTIPFDAPEPMTVAMMQMNDAPPAPRSLRPELSEAIEDVLLKLLDKEPENRYQTGYEFVQALEAAVRGDTELEHHTTSPRLSIPEIVALEMDKNPLPPIPAAVTPVQKKSTEMPSITARAAEVESNSLPTTPHMAVPTQPAVAPVITPTPTMPRTIAPPRTSSELYPVQQNTLMTYAPYAIVGTIIALVLIIAAVVFSGMGRSDGDATESAIGENPTLDNNAILAATETAQAFNLVESQVAETQTSFAIESANQQTQAAPIVPTSDVSVIIPTNNVSVIIPTAQMPPPTVDNSALNAAQTQAAINLTQNALPPTLPSATPMPPVINTAAPVVPSHTVRLRLTWDRDRWLVIENESSSPIDLSLLSLSARDNESRLLSGQSFGERLFLQAGQCVAFAHPRRVDDVDADCDLIDIVEVEEGRDRIWENRFNVYYLNTLNERPIQDCGSSDDDESCRIDILLEG